MVQAITAAWQARRTQQVRCKRSSTVVSTQPPGCSGLLHRFQPKAAWADRAKSILSWNSGPSWVEVGSFHDDPLTPWPPHGTCVLSQPRCSSHILSGYETSRVIYKSETAWTNFFVARKRDAAKFGKNRGMETP